MKLLLLILVLLFAPSIASAQCNGVFPNNTVCGNATGSSNTPRATNPSAFSGTAGGTNWQTQYNNAGALGGFNATCLNIMIFGGAGDNSTDNVTPLNNALAALGGTGGCIEFPAGKFKFNSRVSYNFSATPFGVSLVGAGSASTILYWPNTTGGIQFNYSSPGNSVAMSDLALTTGIAGGGNAIELNQTTALQEFAASKFENIFFRGDDNTGNGGSFYWTYGAVVTSVSGTNWGRITLYGDGSHGNGLYFKGPNLSNASIYHNITQSIFNSNNIGIQLGANAQGVTINQSNFQNGQIGISGDSSVTGQSQLQIINSQFAENSDAIVMNSAYSGVFIANNDIFPAASHGGIILNPNNGCNIANNSILNGGSISGQTGIVLDATTAGSQCNISGNTISGMASGIWLKSGQINTTVQGNSVINNTNGVLNNATGTTNVIINNIGYNPVGTSAAVTMGTSPFTVTAGPSPETHYVKQTATNTATIVKGAAIQIAALVNASTYYVIELGPNENYTTTWTTTAPTYTKDVH